MVPGLGLKPRGVAGGSLLAAKGVLILLVSYQNFWGATQNQWRPTPHPVLVSVHHSHYMVAHGS